MSRALVADVFLIKRAPVFLTAVIRCELPVVGWSRLRWPLLCHLVPAIGHSSFALLAFLVVVPCGNQQEWHGVFGIIVLMENFQGIFKSIAAAPVHVAVQAPGRFCVIEAGPDRTHHHFSRTIPKFLVKLFEILLSPIAPVCLP